MVKALLLDADGVLIQASRKFSQTLAQDRGISLETTKPFFAGQFRECLTGAADLREVIQPFLLQWGVPESVDEFLQYWFQSENCINQNLLSVIQQFRDDGIRAYLATNNETHRTAFMEHEMHLGDLLDGVYSSSKLGIVKPNPVFFQRLLSEIACRPEEVIFVDDDAGNVTAAVSVGITAQQYSDERQFVEFVEYNLQDP